MPEPQHINFQSKDNKQGRDVNDVPPELREKVVALLAQDQETVYKNYEEMIDDDIARELARINLPLSTYTEWYWQMDLKNMFHFYASAWIIMHSGRFKNTGVQWRKLSKLFVR